jgi:dephospho-CoA kinase
VEKCGSRSRLKQDIKHNSQIEDRGMGVAAKSTDSEIPESNVIVLTGSIGSGKSSAARYFAELGAAIVSADALAHEALAPGTESYRHICAEFGPSIIKADGQIERKVLGEIVFSDREKKARLESIVHPYVRKRAREEFIRRSESGAQVVMYECPLFFESGLDAVPFRAVITLVADEEICRDRIRQRDGLTAAQAEARISQQFPAQLKAERSDFVLHNNGTPAELRQEIHMLWPRLIALPPPPTALPTN